MLAIKNGTIVTTTGTFVGELLVDGEKILAIGQHLGTPDGAREIDANGCLVLPGVIDPHLHFDLVAGAFKTRDTFHYGSRAAASGGVTAYIDYISQKKGESFEHAITSRRAEADGNTLIDYSLHFNVTDIDNGQMDELPGLVDQGISSIKVYTTYKESGFYADDWLWFTLLKQSREHGLLIEAHCENDDVLMGLLRQFVAEGKTSFRYHGMARPGFTETEAVFRGLCLSRAANASSYYVHQSAAESIDAITEARLAGQPAIAETCPHFLVLTDEVYAGDHPERYIMTPPVRDAENQQRLWEHLAKGNIQVIGSDHCGYSLDQRLEYNDFTKVSPGVPGTELLLTLMYSEGVARGRITLEQLVALTSTNAARVFGFAPDKGELRPGADADIVIFDPAVRWTITADKLHSAAGYSPYEGIEASGRVRTTISRGHIVYDQGEFPTGPQHGRFTKRRPHDPERSVP